MRASELYELFDTNSDVEWTIDDDDMKAGYFELNGQKFKIEIYVKDPELNTWGVIYGFIENGNVRLSPSGDSPRDASKVLGTVTNELAKFINERKPSALVFSGAKGYGLHKLYTLMLRNLEKKIQTIGYHVESNVDGETSNFAIVSNKFDSYDDISSDLHEAFDTEAHVDWIEQEADGQIGEFEVNGVKFQISFDSAKPGIWKVYYGDIDDGPDTNFNPNGRSGNSAVKVLSVVVNIILDFIIQRKPQMLRFSGSKGVGLGALYSRMARHLEPQLEKRGYYIEKQETGRDDYFAIVKKV